MRQIVLYSAASLDNYIARPDGNVEWLDAPEYDLPDEDYGYTDFNQTIDTTMMGHNTYKALLGFDVPFPYPDKTNYIFSRSADHQDSEFVKFISGDIVNFVQELKNEKGKDIWLIGGGQINTLLLNNELIDKVRLTLFPVTLGVGIPLFLGQAKETTLKLESNKTYENGFVQLTYAINK